MVSSTAMFHRVERQFSGDGLTRLAGEAVQPDAWRHGRKLIDQRFIAKGPLPEGAAKPCGCGRYWVGEPADHGCSAKPTKKEK